MTTPRRALILVDVQQEYFSGPLEIQYPPHAQSLPRIAAALDSAAAAGLPIAVVQHSAGEGAPVFDPSGPSFALHPEIEKRRSDSWKNVTKQFGTVFAGTDLLDWLREHDVDTITLVGYMTNNCILASAAEAETHGLRAEVLSDATGAIAIANDAGTIDAHSLHTTLMALLNSNFAAVAPTTVWISALKGEYTLPMSSLPESATAGAAR
ncbi:isochorismatase family protein [Rathayibacter sp. AY1F9]|uniref:isochorismatase family protein n=1 Tax=Rathayibacter sp. AY1F9 TaxID=2080563 RepID=UPI000CE8EAE3|nr:isochorismatase family protein [Rathayibacter sp. AY1F9]PPH26591.1 isochorismatase [Rathayibacter sp. AY1F9]